MGFKRLLFRLLKRLVLWGLNRLFKYIDRNDDGSLSREEIERFAKDTRNFGQRILNKVF